MKSTFTYKCIAFTLSFLVLLSSSGMAMDLHFCKDTLQHITLLKKVETCHTQKAKKTSRFCCLQQKNKDEAHIKKNERKKCCENKTITLDTSDDAFSIAKTSTLPSYTVYFLSAYAYTQLGLCIHTPQNKDIGGYSPPLRSKDITLLIQRFLI